MPKKGYKRTDEEKRKRSETLKGIIRSAEFKQKISNAMKGKKKSEEYKKKVSETVKNKIRLGTFYTPCRKGKEHWNWQGGKTFEPYGLEFNENLKEVIRNRDRRKCQICEKTELEERRKLSIHHIDYNKQNNNPNNLISLCERCHLKTNYNRNYWINFFEDKISGSM